MQKGMKYLAWLVAAAAVAGTAMLLLSGLGTRFGAWDFRFGLQVLTYGIYAALGALALAILWGLLRIFSGPGQEGRYVSLAAVLSVLVLAYPLYQISIARSVPPIHDISTDTADPPPFVAIVPLRAAAGASNPPEYPGVETAEQQKSAYPDIQPIVSQKPPAELFAAAVNAAEAMGWEIVEKNPIEGRIEATATTFWFGFKDDIVIRIRPEGSGSRLDIRSKSRVGKSDVGANAERIRAFRSKLAA